MLIYLSKYKANEKKEDLGRLNMFYKDKVPDCEDLRQYEKNKI